MSSHHIVKDEQEPALLLDDLDHFEWEMLGQLLEWSPTIIAREQLAAYLESKQIKVDLILPENTSFIDSGLSYLIKKAYPAANIISSQLSSATLFPYLEYLNITLYKGHKKTYSVKSGFSKWKPAGEVLELLADKSEIRYIGLKEKSHPLYETTADGFFQIYFKSPLIFIAEEL